MRRLIIFLGLLVLPTAAPGSNPETIHRTEHRIGILAKRGAERCLEKWNPTAAYLDKTVPGHSFTIIPLDFEQITPATAAGDIDFILANSAFYVQLEAIYRVRRLVTLKNQLAGRSFTTFGGVIFCREDRSDITGLGDLPGMSFAAVKATSFGGWHCAWRELNTSGIDPDRDFSDLIFSGTHDAVVESVLAGEVDAGTVRTDTLERMALENLIDLKDIKVITATTEDDPNFPFLLSTRLYPEWPFAALRHTPAPLTESVAAALLAMPTDDPAAVAARSQGWTVPLNYQPVHDCARELGIGFYAHKGDISLVEFMQMHWPWVVGSLAAFLSIVIIAAAFARKNQALLEVRRHLQEELVERHKTQNALENSEKRYRELVERAADAIFILDPDGNFLEVNKAVTHLTGFTQNEVIGRHFLPAFDPIDRAQAQEALEICLQGKSVEFDSRIQRKGKDSAWFSVGIQPVFDAGGDVVGIQGIAHDIAERKRTEHRKHQEGEAYLRTILESTGDGILAVNTENRIMHANSRFNDMWNLPAAAISGGDCGPIYELMLAQLDDPGSLRDCIEIPAQVEKRGVLHLKDGRVFERFSCPLVFEEIVEGRVCSYRDITARQKAEKERERLLSAIEQAAETIVITDVTGAIEYVNPAFALISGYTREEVIGANPNILSSGHHDTAFFANLWNTVIGGDTWKGRIVNRRKDGTTFTEDVVISPVRDTAGQVAHFVAVKRDVSREIELEAQLRQSQKMEAIGQLAGGIAHDFNNLLQVIDGHIDLLLAALPDDSLNREDAETVRDATDRAANLTRQLLTFSRQQWIQPVDLDLNQLVADLMKLLRRVIGAPTSLRVISAPDLGIIRADPGQIEQVLVNLCINARDAMPSGGTLTIECENVVCDSDPDGFPDAKAGAFVCLSVTDSGTGMDAETLEHIFEPFFTTKETGHGTGLGLATVYGIIQQHQGMIQVDSRPGEGSTFKVFLPTVQPETAEEDSGTNDLEPKLEGTETILIAEDEEAVLDLSRRILEQNGYRVLPASDGGEALRVFEEHMDEIQLVLLDIVMPIMSGRDVMIKLREKRPNLPILFTTGYSQHTANVDFVLEDGLQLLRKPYHTHELLGKIREILDR